MRYRDAIISPDESALFNERRWKGAREELVETSPVFCSRTSTDTTGLGVGPHHRRGLVWGYIPGPFATPRWSRKSDFFVTDYYWSRYIPDTEQRV